jgi:DNA processing protein
MDRKLAWIGLNAIPSLTPRRLGKLLERAGGPEGAWQASLSLLREALGEEVAARVAEERKSVDPDRELASVQKHGGRVITWEEEDYPAPFREVPTPPPVLYVLGEIREQDGRGVAIVGTRRCTSYGRLVAKGLARELGERGISVISGLAPGIDTAAHRGALASRGRTVAVLGTGIGNPYPAGSERLIEEIAARGAVISEFPWEMGGSRWSFPRRNRLVAALAEVVVVVEAPLRSGALITVDWALRLGREVMAVPGPITSSASAGTNRLIQEGAKPVTGTEDVLEELSLPSVPSPREGTDLDSQARTVYDLLALEPLGISELVERTGLSHGRVSQILVDLQLRGLVAEIAGRRYTKAS